MAIAIKPERAIKDAILARAAALSAKDADAIFKSGAAGFVGFSLAPPLKENGGKDGLRAWLASWDGPIGLELRDLKVVADGDVAYAHGFVHMTGRKTDGAAVDLWYRQTLGLRRRGDAWKIVHEHSSVPFYMDGSFKAAVDLTP
jgi:ketosteroid isomerase-like protein